MKKEYKIDGMSCGHCRKMVESALNSIDGVEATVSLDPPIATIQFTGGEKPLSELQAALSERGDYKIF